MKKLMGPATPLPVDAAPRAEGSKPRAEFRRFHSIKKAVVAVGTLAVLGAGAAACTYTVRGYVGGQDAAADTSAGKDANGDTAKTDAIGDAMNDVMTDASGDALDDAGPSDSQDAGQKWDPAWRACRTITSNKQGPDPIPANYPRSVVTDFQISNPGGIRFYKGTCDGMDTSTGPLDMWVESSDASGVRVWTHTVDPDVLQFAMLYDNPAAPDISDGNKLFTLFDSFNGTSLDTGKWTCNVTGGCIVSSYTLVITGLTATYPSVESVQAFGTGTSFNARISFEGTSATHNFDAYAGFSTVPSGKSISWVYEGPSTKYAYEYNTADDTSAKTATDNMFHTWRIDRNSASAEFYYDNALTYTLSTSYPTGTYPIIMNVTQSTITMRVDWMFVRPKMEPDIVNVTGPEQTQ